ncbi:MAG: aspartate/glutamate racemase family protein [Acidobacteriota bacterium]
MTRTHSVSPSPASTSPDAPVLGLLGGMSPESTVDYYQRINAGVRAVLGGHHSARLLIYSADLEQVFGWMHDGDDGALAGHLVAAARHLEGAGADAVLMACNTAHKVAPEIEAALSVPFFHIADVLGDGLRSAGHHRVGLLASRITAEASFYRDRLERFGVEVIVPSADEREEVDRVIREELCFHEILPASRRRFDAIASRLRHRGADAVTLACTEIGLLVDTPELGGLPVFDTTALHAERAVEWLLGQRSGATPWKAA